MRGGKSLRGVDHTLKHCPAAAWEALSGACSQPLHTLSDSALYSLLLCISTGSNLMKGSNAGRELLADPKHAFLPNASKW